MSRASECNGGAPDCGAGHGHDAGHGHGHSHAHGGHDHSDHAHHHADMTTAGSRKRVAIAGMLTGIFMVAEIIGGVHPGVPSTNPLTAAKAALKALGVERLGLVTPYSPDVTTAMQAKFDEAGVAVTLVGSFYEESDAVVGRIDPASILKAAISVGEAADVDGVFVSCTSLRAAGIIGKAETALGKPVTASNHALAWHLLRLAGVRDDVPGMGRLFQL